MLFRQLLHDETACASYVLGCRSRGQLAVVDPHADLVDDYLTIAAAQGASIVAVLETHVQADHVSGLPELVARTGASAYLPAGAGVAFEHVALHDGEEVVLGNVTIRALSTPGHAGAHHAYAIVDRARGHDVWMVLTGDALLVGDAGRPDLHAGAEATPRDMAARLHRSIETQLLTLPDDVLVWPAHYAGSVCGRGLSPVPVSTIGYERRNNPALQHKTEATFVDALLHEVPPPPAAQAEIVAANRAGRPLTAAG